MPRPCNASPRACTSARRSQRSSRSWTRSSTAWLSGYARAKHSVSCSELSSLTLQQLARLQARRSRSRSAAAAGPKVSRSFASRRMARARWGTRRVLLTRASLFASDAVLLPHAVEVVAIDAREARGFGHVVLCAFEQVEHVALLEGVDGGGARFFEGHAQQGVVALVTGERAGGRRPARVGARSLAAWQRGCVARLRVMHNCFATSGLRNHVAHRSGTIVSFGVAEDA